MFLPGAWPENDRIRRDGSANLVHAAIAEGVQRSIQEVVRAGLSRPRRGMDRRDDADRAGALQPHRRRRGGLDATLRDRAATHRRDPAVRRPSTAPTRARLRDPSSYVRRGLRADALELVEPTSRRFRTTMPPPRVVAATRRAGPAPTTWSTTSRCAIASISTRSPSRLGVASPRLPPPWLTLSCSARRARCSRARSACRTASCAAQCGWAPRYRSVREGFAAVLAQPAARRRSPARTALR